MGGEGYTIAVLGIAATLAVAAISALEQQTRHQLRSELAGALIQCEERLTRRVERLEKSSHGFQQWNRKHGDTDDE